MHHFGWTWDYVLNDIDWRIVQRLMIDFPRVDYGDEEEKKLEKKLTPESTAAFFGQFKNVSK